MTLASDLLKSAPFAYFYLAVDYVQRRWFTHAWPENAPEHVTTIDPDDAEAYLRARHFEGLYLSYDYEGQVLNLRRPEGVAADGTPIEVHLRARRNDADSWAYIGHVEACRYEAKGKHIREEYLQWLTPGKVAEYLPDE